MKIKNPNFSQSLLMRFHLTMHVEQMPLCIRFVDDIVVLYEKSF